ncbi:MULTISPECIES: MerR family transcriptional regulator [Ramlibacter]|uniref:MerR family transcriptional regulator n=1 Tax=Ramlibacter pinisoli TaxID=2682844 RepID=A0A6N8J0G3_9BURK|nr:MULTISPECIES: helix-turn-helix domain-containing protein [Ramlibacter]MBA2961801.1 helix-turn-helix domain-containing protein [Ramlibacter sp. CGMCC 1.13660]MVQ31743.1 MerR family transcriptional regulator [Ramlibacter pinisoli]
MSAVLPLSIGAASKQTGCSVPTIRYYEEIGLLPAALRSEGNQRHYDEAAIQRLTFIRRCRDFGFTIEQVRELVGLVHQPDRDCVEVRDIAQLHLQEVQKKLAELQALEASLSKFVLSCNAACVGGPAADCTILEDLAMPASRTGKPTAGRSCCS